MNILLIDTCQQGLALGLKTPTDLYIHQDADYRAQAETFLTNLSSLLAQAKMDMSAIDVIGVTRGPGAFTGLRVGISAAQGLALAHDLPIVAISSLQWLAQTTRRITGRSIVTVARDARMHAIYWGRYCADKSAIMVPDMSEQLSAPDMLSEVSDMGVAAGDAWQTYPEQMPNVPHSGVFWGELVDLLALVEANWQAGQYCSAKTLAPVYLRDNVTS